MAIGYKYSQVNWLLTQIITWTSAGMTNNFYSTIALRELSSQLNKATTMKQCVIDNK
jgi:hypothetical protein